MKGGGASGVGDRGERIKRPVIGEPVGSRPGHARGWSPYAPSIRSTPAPTGRGPGSNPGRRVIAAGDFNALAAT